MFALTYVNTCWTLFMQRDAQNVNNFQGSVLRKRGPGGQEAASTVNVLTAHGRGWERLRLVV